MEFNILGIGVPELILIFVIMLTVAGPKRMVVWAYQLGIYMQKFRRMFDETVAAFRKELEASDLDLPKEIRDLRNMKGGKFDIVQEANKVINTDLNQPIPTSSITDPASANSAPAASSDASPSSSVQEPSPKAQSDDEKPRYDSWLPKQ